VAAASGIRMAFQPIVDLGSGQAVGHEALARFEDCTCPAGWFQLAHQVGLGVEMEMLALSRTLAALPIGADGFISINLSPMAILSSTLPEALALHRTGCQIVLELTEHTAVTDYQPLRDALRRLRDQGCLFAVDDLGSGFASLRHVLDLHPDMVKLDRSLVESIDTDPVRKKLAAALVEFSASFDCVVIAEGIERVEEQIACLDIGVQLGQGYLFGRPTFPRRSAADASGDVGPA
jgi:EAL domain-containing protein (putative c-di-GMP-specific phosphodiesterase class I)